MTPLKLLIASVDRTAWLANGYSIDIEKVLSSETFHLAILDLDSTAGAYRPSVGDDIHLTRTDELGADIELLFGGAIANVIDEPIIDDSGTVTRVRCRDWMVLADQVFIPPRTYASAPARDVFTAIVEEYLGPKGVIVITAPSGGPLLPELRIDDFVTSVRQTLDRITLQVGWPWRINGDKWAALDEPGDLLGPATLADDGQSVLTDPPLRWEQQVLTHATRVWVQTNVPEAGPGPYVYTETITPPSGTSVVPVHVLPTEIRGATTADAALGAMSLGVDGLPHDAAIRIGARFQIETHTTVYELLSATTTDADGLATVALSAGLEKDVKEGTAVTFLRGAFVQLELNGVVTPMDGAPYVWEPNENAIVYPAGDLGGIAVTYRTWALHPTMVREWDPVAQLPIGWFDYAHVIDQQIAEEEGHTDLDTARTFARAELAKRLTPPKRVTCTTRIPGHYPILLVPMAFPDRLVVGDYLVAETRIRHSTIDENSDEQPLLYELVLWEGDALGESWVQYFRGRNPSQGIRWGQVVPPDLTVVLLIGAETAIVDESTYARTLTSAGTVARTTAQFKYGTASLTFDGFGSYVSASDSADWAFGTGDFTVEGWFRFVTKTDTQALLGQWGTIVAATAWFFYVVGGQLAFRNQIGSSGTYRDLAFTWTPTLGQWYHLAVDRSGSTLRLYIDGVVVATNAAFADTLMDATSPLTVGAIGLGGFAGFDFNGQMDEIRITKGLARYAGPFTAPAGPFPR